MHKPPKINSRLTALAQDIVGSYPISPGSEMTGEASVARKTCSNQERFYRSDEALTEEGQMALAAHPEAFDDISHVD